MDPATETSDATSQRATRVTRRNVRASRNSIPMSPSSQVKSPIDNSLKLDAISASSPQTVKVQPLCDITHSAVNERHSLVSLADHGEATENFVFPSSDKPMEMAIRARAKAASLPIEPETSASRTVIKYLVLQNFKSYAGRQEVGPFHASFSSVVGPNGSGKSNVIDSLLFVFGFRASKMRQGKISSLIHNSAAFPDLEYCEVEVHFEEVRDLSNGQKELIPDSTLVISRKAFKNNSSKYYINGKESNFTAVTTLLKDRGVDLDHKRFLILQGEVESIAQMKPKALNEHDDGLLEYLEDIIGTSKYKRPIEESAAEIETLNEVCTEKNSRVQHVEKEKKNLETKRNAAISYIQDENDLTLKQSSLCQIFMHECNDNIQVSQEAVQQMQSQLDHELERHKGSQDSIRALEKQYESHVKQYESVEASTRSVMQQLTKADKETVKIEEKRKHLHAKVKKLEKAIAGSDSGLAEASAYLQRLTDDIGRNSKQILEIENSLGIEDAELGRIREGLRGKTEGLSNEISLKQQELEPWTAQVGEKQSVIALAQSELSILLERQEEGSQALSKIDARLIEIEKDRSKKVEQIADAKANREQKQLEFQDLQAELKKLSDREPQVKAQLSSARQQTDEARASLAKSQAQGTVLAGLNRLSDSGRVTGFHGRLGNLGTIDQTYDVAISTACPALDNLVVDTVEGGQQCIEYLRKNNLGRANFILLERLTSRDLTAIDTPEGVPRLFDLVKTKDDRFRLAFYSVLQNTLVAQDLHQANRIAYGSKRWRVVTLDGQLIDKSGTMSGGGNRITRGAMSAKLVKSISKDQVAKLEAQQETEEQQARCLQDEMGKLTDLLNHVSDDLPRLDTTLQRLQLDLDSTNRGLADSRRRRDELATSEKTAKVDQSRVAKLEQVIHDTEEELVSLHEKSIGIESDIKVLQDKIMEVGGVKLRMQKARVDGLREQLHTLTEELSSAESNIGKTQKQQEKHGKTKGEAEANLATMLEDIGKLDEELDAHLQNQAKARQQASEAEEELEGKGEKMHALKKEVEQMTADLNEARYVEVEMRNKLDENQKALAENLKRRTYWEDKLQKLTINPVEELGKAEDERTLTIYTPDELADLDKTVLKGEIAVLEEKLQNTDVDLSVIDEYRRRVEEHAERSSDLAQAIEARDTAKRRSEELRRLRLEGFMNGFSTISMRLKEMYQMITMGGNAELELVDSLDPFSEGILFSVMPPKKSWKNISNLSGGEKTLSSLALVFALHHYKPTPLYVMDEIDAALDFRNVSIVASYIKERTKNAQFIVISLRNNMFELASRLVGVYKVNHMTKSVTVENRDYIHRN